MQGLAKFCMVYGICQLALVPSPLLQRLVCHDKLLSLLAHALHGLFLIFLLPLP